ncbi:hypothetical protein ACFQV2_07230 [Actinokineospora soli]|uniref:Uncharacterized protein n=1 Tax=Actinokineospora soli TaxID=1048753 RepID=A0ABW2TI84_9PSEU
MPLDLPPHLISDFHGAPPAGSVLVAGLLLAVAVAVPWAASRAGRCRRRRLG